MEAENYLASGYGTRLALEAVLHGCCRLGEVAEVLQPSRLKGILVSPEYGTPFLAATQIFDVRPVPRKFLALSKTDSPSERFAVPGQILITRSGTVGRATLATSALNNTLLSDDLLRARPKDQQRWGWLYAFLRSKTVRSMMTSAKYGHIIKHLEPSHVAALPMPTPTDTLIGRFQADARRVLDDRNRAVGLLAEAERLFEESVGVPRSLDIGETGFSVKASTLTSRRRRLEAVYNNPLVEALGAHFASKRLATTCLRDAGFDVWLPTRFRRIPAEEGVQLVGSADLFEINPDLEKRIADIDFGDPHSGRVKQGWLLLARSGQTYGLNGTLAIANAFHEGKVISDHVIRIAPGKSCNMRTGYVYAALSHPVLGRPLVKSLAYGSSIPEIDPSDIALMPFPRLEAKREEEIASKAEEGAQLFAEADILENEMSSAVDDMLERLLAGNRTDFVLPR